MLQEPLFQENILSTILRNFDFYLFGSNWLPYALGLLALLSLTVLTLKWAGAEKENYLFPPHHIPFNRYNQSGLYFCLLCFGIYAFNVFSLDNTLFNNYDLMSVNTTFIFDKGVAATYANDRLAPISFFDLNFLYAVTHNFALINIYVILKQALILWLLFNLLDYISIKTRLLLIGTITLLPAVFWVNNIIFPEQNELIFLLSSFICLRRYTQKHQFRYLWLYCFLALLAVYTKETAIIFYFGILIYNLLYYVFHDKINYHNLFRPWLMAKAFPFEFITFLIGLSFALFYFHTVNSMSENAYVQLRQKPLFDLIKLFKTEIILTVIAWIVFIKKLFKKEDFSTLINEAFLWGATSILLFLLFILKMDAGVPHTAHKTYYAVLCSIFSIIYISSNLKNIALYIIFTIIICWSCATNYYFHHKENGVYYRQIADFMAEELTKEPQITISFFKNTEPLTWIYETWSSAFMYYFPDKDITFKFLWLKNSPKEDLDLYVYHRYYKAKKLTKISSDILAANDYCILKKNSAHYQENKQDISKFTPSLVFENKIFEVYKLK